MRLSSRLHASSRFVRCARFPGPLRAAILVPPPAVVTAVRGVGAVHFARGGSGTAQRIMRPVDVAPAGTVQRLSAATKAIIAQHKKDLSGATARSLPPPVPARLPNAAAIMAAHRKKSRPLPALPSTKAQQPKRARISYEGRHYS